MSAVDPRVVAAGQKLVSWLEKARIRVQPHFDRWLASMESAQKEREHRGFEADADYAILHQEPLRARVLLKSLGIAPVLDLPSVGANLHDGTGPGGGVLEEALKAVAPARQPRGRPG